MSRENVEIMRDAYAAWNRGDMEAVLERFAPDVILAALPNWPEADDVAGREAVARLFKDMRDGFERDWIEVRELMDLGDDRVLAVVRWCGTPLGGGEGALSVDAAIVYKLRQGRVTHAAHHAGRKQAIEAAGLEE